MPLSDVFNLSSCRFNQEEPEGGVLDSLNLEGSTVSTTDLASWGRMWMGEVTAAFCSAATPCREESLSPLFYSIQPVKTVFSGRTELTEG